MVRRDLRGKRGVGRGTKKRDNKEGPSGWRGGERGMAGAHIVKIGGLTRRTMKKEKTGFVSFDGRKGKRLS